ncbi:MAG TPA: nucleotidyltransferase domain-containing protein [Chitinophagaceae bacterium]|nr:nucleotidyltransferase domain-containing protein [Chitinophagaceae bacterium]
MHPAAKSILKVIAYFDLFNYPVTFDEIIFFLDHAYTEAEVSEEIQLLVSTGIIYRMNNLYAANPDYAFVERRLAGNRQAEKQLKLASKIARFLIRFPYIRGVAISGSLSKNFAYKGSDIDFFIITETGRLWIARFIFTCFFYAAKLVGLKSWFCLNYFIDTAAAEIPEKNIYTAIEIATLMPKQGPQVFRDFYRKNKWVQHYLPNHASPLRDVEDCKGGLVKAFAEWLLSGKMGDKFENFLCVFYRNRWQKLLEKKKFAKNGFQFGSYIAGVHVCKPMPHYFQSKLLNRFDEKLKEIEGSITLAQQVAV